MTRLTALCALALLSITVASPARAQTLTTAVANNGSGGVFLDLQPVSAPLRLTGFDVPLMATAGTPVTVEVWTRPGSYVGFTNSSTGWTLTQSVTANSGGSSTPVPYVLTTPITLPASGITAIYLQAVLPAAISNGIQYTGIGGSPPQTMWSNATIVLFSDTVRTGFVAFGGMQFTPRTFSGTIRYQSDALFTNGFE